ncbi:MAG: cyanophycin synthetase [bacterium]|nr:cyanophycin synthetase [bacterium]
MKNILKSIVVSMLAIAARSVVQRYHPRIVMITGSVGKTSTKDAVATVLASRFYVRKSEKSFNSEFGVPFTILGVSNPWGNPLAWLSIVRSTLALLVLPNHYPNMLVLEVGADRPGDLKRIVRIATPDAVVVTRLPEIPVHVEAYASPEAVREEEFSPAYALPPASPLIISSDDQYALDMAMRIPAHIISYGSSENAMVRISSAKCHEKSRKVIGMQANVSVEGEKGELVVHGSVGSVQLLPAAAALAVGRAFHIPLPEAIKALEAYVPPPGRGRILEGLNGSIIIDDSYNASPAAVEEALETLKHFPHAKRRIAVLGDMLELGRYSVMEHEHIGKLARSAADVVVAVGIRSRAFVTVPGDAEVQSFDTAQAVVHALPELVQKGDVILVKGSQSVRTERIVEALLANRSDVAKLVRQESAWKKL